MRPVLSALLLTSVLAGPVAAAESGEEPMTREPALAPAIEPEAPVAPRLHLEPVRVEEHAAEADAAQIQTPARGSFWWMVGVIVVAGLILAILI